MWLPSSGPDKPSRAIIMLVFCLAYSLALKMDATCSSETSVDFHRTAWRYIPEFFVTTAVRTSNPSLPLFKGSRIGPVAYYCKTQELTSWSDIGVKREPHTPSCTTKGVLERHVSLPEYAAQRSVFWTETLSFTRNQICSIMRSQLSTLLLQNESCPCT
jgi:hypothetical protein